MCIFAGREESSTVNPGQLPPIAIFKRMKKLLIPHNYT